MVLHNKWKTPKPALPALTLPLIWKSNDWRQLIIDNYNFLEPLISLRGTKSMIEENTLTLVFFLFNFPLKKFPTPHTQCWYINLFGLDPPPQTCSCNTRRLHFSLCVILRLVFTQVILVLEHNTTKIASMFRPTTTNISGVGERGSSILSALFQTWKKAQTCGYCPWIFLRIVEDYLLLVWSRTLKFPRKY